jgi:hypothetical protein
MKDILNFLRKCHRFSIVFFVLGQFATTLLFFGKTLDSYFKIIINKIYPLQTKLHINDWFLKL